MLGTASSASTRIVSASLICLGAVLLAMFGMLALSSAARADSTVEAQPEGLTSEQAPESSGDEATGPESQPGGSGPEGSGSEAESPEPSEPQLIESAPEPAPITPEPTPAPIAPEPAPVEVTPEPVPVLPTPEAVKEPAPETLTHESSEEKEKPREKTSEPVAMSAAPTTPTGTAMGLIAAESEGTPPSGPIPPTGSEIVQLGEGQEALAGTSEEALSRSRGASERQAVARRCELSALGGPEAGGCDGGWLGATTKPNEAPVALSSNTPSLAPTAGGSSGDEGPGGVAGGGRPVSPSPGPAPGGASGGVAAGGSGGVGLSGFLTLAGLLLLAAPRALRRLRLSCRPWLTAFFVLIPERPG
jgi:outer membrane biosynthesis protein TonB